MRHWAKVLAVLYTGGDVLLWRWWLREERRRSDAQVQHRPTPADLEHPERPRGAYGNGS